MKSAVNPQTTASNKPLVLLIEDDSLLSKMYRKKFIKEDFDVLQASNGEEGLKLAFEKIPKIIVLDLMMPKLPGLDFLQKLRQNQLTKSIPVIVLTNLSRQEETQKAKSLGVKEILLKANLTPKQVVDKVKIHLGL